MVSNRYTQGGEATSWGRKNTPPTQRVNIHISLTIVVTAESRNHMKDNSVHSLFWPNSLNTFDLFLGPESSRKIPTPMLGPE